MVLAMVSRGMVRWKTLISSLPRKRFQMIRERRAALVVLTPPPVDPGDAPINIRVMMRRIEAFVRLPISTVLKPHVRGEADWKKEART
jgi:hypothetical protein